MAPEERSMVQAGGNTTDGDYLNIFMAIVSQI